jgi:hypothetical protein
MDIVELQPPGKVLKKEELKFAIHSAAKVFDNRMKRLAPRPGDLVAAHGMCKRAPLSVVLRNPWSENQVVLIDACPVKAAAIEYDSEV